MPMTSQPTNGQAPGLCYICDEYPPVVRAYGGQGVAFWEQAEGFARRGRRVSVICRTADSRPGVHRINGVGVHVVAPSTIPKARAVLDRLALNPLIRRICTAPEDIVVTAEFAGPLLVRAFINPLIVHLEGSMTVTSVDLRGSVNRLARFFERRTVDLADAVSCVSDYAGRLTLAALGARPRTVRVVPNSVNTTVFHPAPAADVDPRRVLFVGKMNRMKGAHVVADAIRSVFAAVPDATLTIVGPDLIDEHGESGMARFLDRLDAGERSRLRLLGPVGREDVAREMRTCALMVVPSLSDMCPTVVVEGMSSGRPVVGSRCGGIPELLRDGLTGLLADPEQPDTFAEAIIALLRDRARADTMGAAGRDVVLQHYTSDAIVDDLDAYYDAFTRERAKEKPCAVLPVS